MSDQRVLSPEQQFLEDLIEKGFDFFSEAFYRALMQFIVFDSEDPGEQMKQNVKEYCLQFVNIKASEEVFNYVDKGGKFKEGNVDQNIEAVQAELEHRIHEIYEEAWKNDSVRFTKIKVELDKLLTEFVRNCKNDVMRTANQMKRPTSILLVEEWDRTYLKNMYSLDGDFDKVIENTLKKDIAPSILAGLQAAVPRVYGPKTIKALNEGLAELTALFTEKARSMGLVFGGEPKLVEDFYNGHRFLLPKEPGPGDLVIPTGGLEMCRCTPGCPFESRQIAYRRVDENFR